jgi:acetyl esterase
MYMLSYEDARVVFAKHNRSSGEKPFASIVDISIPVGSMSCVEVRIVRPDTSGRRLPAILYLHGGGWIMGSKDTHDRLVRMLAVGADATVFFVEYSPAPDEQYPRQNEEAYAVLSFIEAHALDLNVDGKRIAIAGDGAGGNMAAALTLMAKARGGPAISIQVLFYPMTDDISSNVSYREFAEGPVLALPDMAYFFDAYFPNATLRNEITAFPLRASLDDLRDLPEALVIVSEIDVLRDEGEAYARKLVSAGVRVTAVRYCGTVHGFLVLDALADTPPARAAIAQAIYALRAALHRA